MAAAALPKWVMLERFVFRRDDPNSFRKDERTSASCITCTGTRIEVSFVLAEPPTPPRVYLSWPEGPKDEQVCHLVAAHRDLVLLRLSSLVDESVPFGEARHEYFIYIAAPTFQVPPFLRPLPQCMEYDPDLERPTTYPFPLRSVGLLCYGAHGFVVASLQVFMSPVTLKMEADLCVLHSSSSCHDDDGAEDWNKKRLPILCQEDEHDDLWSWNCNEVVPFKNSLFWVCYSTGILFCDGILGDNPKISYIRFHPDSFVRDQPSRLRKALYRSLCVTDDGCQLVFVDVARHDGTALGPMAPGTGFTMTFRTLKMTGNSIMPWEWTNDAVVTSAELWAANTPEHLPRKVMMLPLVSIDVPNVVHVVLYGWEIGIFSLVTIDLSDKQLLGSVVPYIKSSKEGICTDDADLVRAKPGFFPHFLPSEFPKFLNLNS